MLRANLLPRSNVHVGPGARRMSAPPALSPSIQPASVPSVPREPAARRASAVFAATAPLVLTGCSGALGTIDPVLVVVSAMVLGATQFIDRRTVREAAEITASALTSLFAATVIAGGTIQMFRESGAGLPSALNGMAVWLSAVAGLAIGARVRKTFPLEPEAVAPRATNAGTPSRLSDISSAGVWREAADLVEAALTHDPACARVVGCAGKDAHGFVGRTAIQVLHVAVMESPWVFAPGLEPRLLVRINATPMQRAYGIFQALLFEAATSTCELMQAHAFWQLAERWQRRPDATLSPPVLAALSVLRPVFRNRPTEDIADAALTEPVRRAVATLAFAYGVQEHPMPWHALAARFDRALGSSARRRWVHLRDAWAAPAAGFFSRMILTPAGVAPSNLLFGKVRAAGNDNLQSVVVDDPLLTSLGAMDYLLSPLDGSQS